MSVKHIRISKSTLDRFDRIVPMLLDWYVLNKRSFIWRDLRTTPYTVLVSEFMLQQTQAETIEKRLPLFLKQFPTIEKLAKASVSDVLRAWQGLGYNRRALNLHKTANVVASRGRKSFPETLEELRLLPGVGPYTASAILVFSFGKDLPLVDVNIERVLSRLWKPMRETASTLPQSEIAALDSAILPKGRSSEWHQALMDIGSTICRKRAPKCETCPLQKQCKSAKYLTSYRIRTKTRAPIRKSESLYFGLPKRIWRGRVLKCVVESSAKSGSGIATHIAIDSSIESRDRSVFDPFVESILADLVREGFIKKNRSSFILQS